MKRQVCVSTVVDREGLHRNDVTGMLLKKRGRHGVMENKDTGPAICPDCCWEHTPLPCPLPTGCTPCPALLLPISST